MLRYGKPKAFRTSDGTAVFVDVASHIAREAMPM